MKRIKFKVNGIPTEVIADEKQVLLDVLRKDLHLTGAKQSCDRQGICGACMVIVDGKTVKSCIKKVIQLEGADIITVEGLGTPDNPHLIQEAYVLSGAIQCGFCMPGMIMATKALLDQNNNPSVEEIKKALRGNLCRCTGYLKIIEAVQLAGRFLRGETTPDAVRPPATAPMIGVSHPRPWSMEKACGVARFGQDIIVSEVLEAAVVRSPHHNARIKSMNYAEAEKMPGVVGIMTAKDIKGTNNNGLMIPDNPVLVVEYAPVIGSPIAIVVAKTRAEAQAAAAAVQVDYEVLPRVATAAEALAEGAPKVNPDPRFGNVSYTNVQHKGDAAKALSESAHVVELKAVTPLVHQAPLEPENALAYMDGEGEDAELVVIGRSIYIHLHAAMLSMALGWGRVRYIEAFSGGHFGIKSDIAGEDIAGAAALHFKQPVRYTASMSESMLITTKRHPFIMDLKLGADKDGKITGYDIDFITENGAHTSTAPSIMDRAIEMLNGPYDLPNINARGRLVYTNDVWGGAARGAGPPQVSFALEVAIDTLAAKLNMDPYEFRLKNSLHPGGTTATGQVVDEWAFYDCLVKLKPAYEKAVREAKKVNTTGTIRRGVGLAGASFGIGPAHDASNMAIELDPDGGVTVYGGVAEPGEGNDAMLAQIAAHCMGLPLDKIRLCTRDSELTPAAGVSASSRQTYMSGGALVMAIENLKAAMKETGAKTHDDLVKAGKPTKYLATKSISNMKGLDKASGQGDIWSTYVHGAQLVEVDVDTKTGVVTVAKLTTVCDPGTVINPQAVLGQIEGGADQGAGYALREHYVAGVTTNYVSYKFPTFATCFPQETTLLESLRPSGPVGATGVGEFTSVAVHPAIANAIYNATGVRFYELPITPEKVLVALGKK